MKHLHLRCRSRTGRWRRCRRSARWPRSSTSPAGSAPEGEGEGEGRPPERRLMTDPPEAMIRGIEKSQVRQCSVFCTADFWSSLVYKSAVQKTQTLPLPLARMESARRRRMMQTKVAAAETMTPTTSQRLQTTTLSKRFA